MIHGSSPIGVRSIQYSIDLFAQSSHFILKYAGKLNVQPFEVKILLRLSAIDIMVRCSLLALVPSTAICFDVAAKSVELPGDGWTPHPPAKARACWWSSRGRAASATGYRSPYKS